MDCILSYYRKVGATWKFWTLWEVGYNKVEDEKTFEIISGEAGCDKPDRKTVRIASGEVGKRLEKYRTQRKQKKYSSSSYELEGTSQLLLQVSPKEIPSREVADQLYNELTHHLLLSGNGRVYGSDQHPDQGLNIHAWVCLPQLASHLLAETATNLGFSDFIIGIENQPPTEAERYFRIISPTPQANTQFTLDTSWMIPPEGEEW